MVMNKKEREALESAQHEVRIARALSWQTAQVGNVRPDVPAPVDSRRATKGWVAHLYFGTPNTMVYPAASDSVSHYSGRTGDQSAIDFVEQWSGRERFGMTSGSRGAIAVHSTRLGALLQLRADLERRCAEMLASVDKQIEQERAEPTVWPAVSHPHQPPT